MIVYLTSSDDHIKIHDLRFFSRKFVANHGHGYGLLVDERAILMPLITLVYGRVEFIVSPLSTNKINILRHSRAL